MKRASFPVFLCFLFSLLCWGAPSQEDIQALWQKAHKGDAQAQVDPGLAYSIGKDMKEAVKWWRLAVKQGLPQAQYNLTP